MKVKFLAQIYTANKWQSWDSNWGLILKAALLANGRVKNTAFSYSLTLRVDRFCDKMCGASPNTLAVLLWPPAGCLTLNFSSDPMYLETVSVPQVKGSTPQNCPHFNASHKSGATNRFPSPHLDHDSVNWLGWHTDKGNVFPGLLWRT